MGSFDTGYVRCPACGEVDAVQVKHGPGSLERWNGKTVPRQVGAGMHGWDQACECGEKFILVWIEPAGPLLSVSNDHFAPIPGEES